MVCHSTYTDRGFQVILGSKRWFLFPPSVTRIVNTFNPNMTVAQWVDTVYPLISRVQAPNTSEGNGAINTEAVLGSDGFSSMRAHEGQRIATTQPSGIIESIGGVDLNNIDNEIYSTNQGDGTDKNNVSINNLDLQSLAATMQECTIEPGEILYFPSMWMHATLNTDAYNVFMSVFIDTQLIK